MPVGKIDRPSLQGYAADLYRFRRGGLSVRGAAAQPHSARQESRLARGARRLRRGRSAADLPLLLLTALTIAGYAFYTWRNPWFVVVKGTSLLGLSLPFSYYASETLADWLRGRFRRQLAAALLALAVCVALSCTFDLVFEKTEVSGLPWPPAEGG